MLTINLFHYNSLFLQNVNDIFFIINLLFEEDLSYQTASVG